MNNNNATIEILSGSNNKRWISYIEYTLGMMDLDMDLHEMNLLSLLMKALKMRELIMRNGKYRTV